MISPSKSLAAYWQQTIGILPTTDFSYGGRIQQTSVTARDTLDPTAPGFFGELPISPLDSSETNHALHIGIEHRFNEVFSVFGRAAERVSHAQCRRKSRRFADLRSDVHRRTAADLLR